MRLFRFGIKKVDNKKGVKFVNLNTVKSKFIIKPTWGNDYQTEIKCIIMYKRFILLNTITETSPINDLVLYNFDEVPKIKVKDLDQLYEDVIDHGGSHDYMCDITKHDLGSSFVSIRDHSSRYAKEGVSDVVFNYPEDLIIIRDGLMKMVDKKREELIEINKERLEKHYEKERKKYK